MTAKVAGVVLQKFVHLATGDADLMKIVRVVTDGAFVVLILMITVMMTAVVVVAVVVVLMIAFVIILMTRG
ncbi:MAG TPA: hypothetical protein VG103_12880 [Chthoniobacterales bacterium]|jgi:hypothetical protein|nr:hypothetical protein [Chthoniobacterales bacterium]